MRDPIVDEIRKLREAHAARFDFDVQAISEEFKKRERESGRTVVVLEPKRIMKTGRSKRRT